MEKDWKLKLRYGKTKTEFKHFTVLADGIVGELVDGFDCKPGNAWMSMKTWSNSADESADMIQYVGGKSDLSVKGKLKFMKLNRLNHQKTNHLAMELISHLMTRNKNYTQQCITENH